MLLEGGQAGDVAIKQHNTNFEQPQLHQHRPQKAAAACSFHRLILKVKRRHSGSSQPSLQKRDGKQGRITSAQHPEKRWETESSQHSVQKNDGRLRETKQNNLSPASRRETGDKWKQSRIISAQHPEEIWRQRRTKPNKGRQRETSRISSAQHPEIILAQDRFYARIEIPSWQSCMRKNKGPFFLY